MTIREVEPGKDAAAIADINRWYVENTTAVFDTVALTPQAMQKKVEGIAEKFPYLVCEIQGKIVGYCFAHKWKEKPAYYPTWENTVYVSPEHTGQGIGEALMKRLIESSREKGCGSLIACITAENEGSRRFHQRLGFQQVSCFRKVGEKFGRLLDVVDYQLTL